MLLTTHYYAPHSYKPSIAKLGDAGIDLKYSGQREFKFIGNTVHKIHTGVHVEIPDGHCGLVFERSGLGSKYGITIHGRVIDSGYRGEIIVLMSRNCSRIVDTDLIGDETYNAIEIEDLIIKPGDRIAQMVVVPFVGVLKEVGSLELLSASERGVTGLGSSGR